MMLMMKRVYASCGQNYCQSFHASRYLADVLHDFVAVKNSRIVDKLPASWRDSNCQFVMRLTSLTVVFHSTALITAVTGLTACLIASAIRAL